VELIDTAGQEQFKALTERYYKKADCCLLVYDITKANSFEECKDYYNENIKQFCKENIKVILLGNKTDLADQREVTPEEGAEFAVKNDYIFMETSCLKNENVADAFETLIEITNIESKKDNNHRRKTISLKKNINKGEKSKCICPFF
jgi:Ras-related protein Rab-11A